MLSFRHSDRYATCKHPARTSQDVFGLDRETPLSVMGGCQSATWSHARGTAAPAPTTGHSARPLRGGLTSPIGLQKGS